MSIRGRQGAAGRLVALALCGVAMSHPAFAQSAAQDPTELDPSAPLDPMPDLGVEWPDMNTPDPVLEPVDGEPALAEDDRSEAIEDNVAARRYGVIITGLGESSTEEFLEAFHQRSALEAEDDDPANTAQIDRRARADAELLTSLLQGQGYYDAEVETEISRNGEQIAVELRANP
ncbi:MAG TPA: outer membrane protein assembly factor, partial [Sphingomicrobium sp.]|nr:outer membrane protein assembly factor [Sphingomicrobium sp.]